MLTSSLDGVWRWVRSNGSRPSHSHMVLWGAIAWEVDPSRALHAGDDLDWIFDVAADPPGLLLRPKNRRYPDRDGVFEVEGERLSLCWDPGAYCVVENARSLDVYERVTDPREIARHREPPALLPATDSDLINIRFRKGRWGARSAEVGWRFRMYGEERDRERFLEAARVRLRALPQRLPALRRLAIETFKYQFQDDDQATAKLTVDFIEILADGRTGLFLDDGDLLGGHAVRFELDAKLEPEDAPDLWG